jgi:hypothetical protein
VAAAAAAGAEQEDVCAMQGLQLCRLNTQPHEATQTSAN